MSQSWMSSLILEPGESIVRSWEGDFETETKVAIKAGFRTRTRDIKDREGGVLVLTNQRLIWFEAKGIFGKSYHTSLTIPLESVRGTSFGGSIRKFVTIADNNESYLFHLLGIGDKEFPIFRQMVTFQMSQRKAALESQRKQERVHVMLDFSFLRQYMEKGGMVVQTFKCSNCGAPIQIPQNGNTVNCTHCQTPQHVDDIFEKIKGLIG